MAGDLMALREPDPGVSVAVAAAALLGESPFWHPRERALYYCDIPGHRLQRFEPASGALAHWDFETDVASCAPRLDGRLLLAMRDGLWNFDPASGARRRVAAPPYDPAKASATRRAASGSARSTSRATRRRPRCTASPGTS
jgi:sugar lactone lactonase YvrE